MKTWAELSSNVSTENREFAKWECVLFREWLKPKPKPKRKKIKPVVPIMVCLPDVEEPAPIHHSKPKQWRSLVKEYMRTRGTPATVEDIVFGLGIRQEADRLRLSSALHHMGVSGILRKVGEVRSGGKSRAFTLWSLP